MKHPVCLLAAALCLSPLYGDFQEVVKKADQLHEREAFAEGRGYLLSSLSQAGSKAEEAELCWRLARVYLNLGDQAEERKAAKGELLALFEEGEKAADRALAADPGNALGYYWKSSNIGRWGQTKGILNSLAKAAPMKDLLEKTISLKPDHADSYYVLGQLYEQLPGLPLSFGNKDYAVSLGRKAVDLQREQLRTGLEKEVRYDFFTELAKHLYGRNWNTEKRLKEQAKKKASFKAKSDLLLKSFYYEGVVELKAVSDRQEAQELVRWVIGELSSQASRKWSQGRDLREAQMVLAGWK